MVTTDPYRHGGAQVAPSISTAPVPIRPVSDEGHALAHEGGGAYLRAGSIRADIARYNEERGASHVPHPPHPGARSSESPPVYRN